MSRERKQTVVESPNEAMNNYIGDLLWPGTNPEPEVAPERLPNDQLPTESLLSISNNIKPGYSLICLTSVERYQLDLSHPHRSLSASFSLLLWGLYLLRKPINGRLRARVMEHCHERMMEYRLLLGITQLRSAGRNPNDS